MNNWKTIWNKRKADITLLENSHNVFDIWKELKRVDGFDVSVGDDASKYYEAFFKMWETNSRLLDEFIGQWHSIYEVGCGAGATLYLFSKQKKRVGGIDYSEKCIEIAKQVIDECDFQYMEAEKITVDEKYDVIMADSVFAYFADEKYALDVLKKMYDKANKAVLITEIFDKRLEEKCIEFRRSKVENYNEKYQGLEKLFLEKGCFSKFAEENGAHIVFTDVKNEYYWNSKFMYNVLIVK